MNNELRIFIGYDPREASAYHVCAQSIIEHTDPNGISFHPICGARRDGSNDFIYARFLVPWRCGFSGFAVFMDGDMIVRDDIRDLMQYARADKGCSVVKHDYRTKYPVKYLGNKNDDYPRKNWSSVVIWNCGYMAHRILTPEYVDGASGAFLHRFGWLADDAIAEIPPQWNRLVLEQETEDGDKLRHFTIGTPCFAEYADSPGAEEWYGALAHAIAPLKR